jgi:hypothetical protein
MRSNRLSGDCMRRNEDRGEEGAREDKREERIYLIYIPLGCIEWGMAMTYSNKIFQIYFAVLAVHERSDQGRMRIL